MVSQDHDDTDTDWDSDLDEIPENGLENAAAQRRQASSAKARERLTEATPLLGRFSPPPAYSDATRNQGLAHQNRTHESRSQHGQDGRAAEPIMFSSDQPQSMSNHPRDPEQGRKGSRKQRWARLRSKTMALLALILLVSITVLSVISVKHENGDSQHDGNGSGNGKGKTPTTPSDRTPGFPHHLDCSFTSISEQEWFEYSSPQSFSFVELIEESGHLSGRIGGQVRILSANKGQNAAIRVGVKYATSGIQVDQLDIRSGSEGLYIKAPPITATNPHACMAIEISMFIRPDISLEDFEVATKSLNIRVEDGIFPSNVESNGKDTFYISNTTDFTLVSGNLSVAYWSSRETRVDIISGSIRGNFALRDVLFIRTRSGSIGVAVEPKPADKNVAKAAEFTALSTSGSVDVNFPIYGTEDDLPQREYHSRVETASGSLRGKYILGSVATFKTLSGSVHIEALPYMAGHPDAVFRTETQVGGIHVDLLNPFGGTDMTNLRSVHKSQSGSVAVTYPQQWDGIVEAQTRSGSLTLIGKDIEVLKRFRTPVGNHVVAKKGNGSGKMDLGTTSGSIRAVIGDTY